MVDAIGNNLHLAVHIFGFEDEERARTKHTRVIKHKSKEYLVKNKYKKKLFANIL